MRNFTKSFLVFLVVWPVLCMVLIFSDKILHSDNNIENFVFYGMAANFVFGKIKNIFDVKELREK
jgi:hypothetical protein